MPEQIIVTREKLRSHYDQIKHYLKSDINALMSYDDSGGDVGCGPYLLSACSGIDFRGTLSLPYAGNGTGLKSKSKQGFKHYATNFLSKVNGIYACNKVPDFIYKNIRSGQVHEGIVKLGVMIGKRLGREYHLTIISIHAGDSRAEVKQYIYFDSRIFAEDFLASLDYFEELFHDAAKSAEMAQCLTDNYQRMLDDLQANLPSKLEAKDINEYNFGDLYNIGSSTPHGSLSTLRSDFYQTLQRPY